MLRRIKGGRILHNMGAHQRRVPPADVRPPLYLYAEALPVSKVSAQDSDEFGWAISTTLTTAVISVPAAAWLFGSALALLGWLRRR